MTSKIIRSVRHYPTLPDSVKVYRVRVPTAMLKSSVPIY